MASVLGFNKKCGVKIIPTKAASWAGVRDKLVNGELDMAHVLRGLIYGVHLGVGGPKKDMAILLSLNHNGQAITLSKKLADKGAVDGPSLAKAMAADKRADGQAHTFAQTFPTGRHAMWLYCWLANAGINPIKDAKVITVPPSQMVANMRVRVSVGMGMGMGKIWADPNHMKFFNDGFVNYPYLSDGMRFLTRHKRWVLLKQHPNYLLVAQQTIQTALYNEAGGALKINIPKSDLRSSKKIDGAVWDGEEPARYTDGFMIKLAAAS